jgi:hypothetical protein
MGGKRKLSALSRCSADSSRLFVEGQPFRQTDCAVFVRGGTSRCARGCVVRLIHDATGNLPVTVSVVAAKTRLPTPKIAVTSTREQKNTSGAIRSLLCSMKKRTLYRSGLNADRQIGRYIMGPHKYENLTRALLLCPNHRPPATQMAGLRGSQTPFTDGSEFPAVTDSASGTVRVAYAPWYLR